MPPLKINVTGTSTISRKAERALVTVIVSSSGPDQAKVIKNVTSTSTKVQNGLRSLHLTDPTTKAPLPEAAITHWSMSTLSTGSYFVWLPNKSKSSSANGGEGDGHKVPNFTARTEFEIKFCDFVKLGSVCTEMANVPFVQVRSVDWRLTDRTKGALVGDSREMAVKDAFSQAQDFAVAAGKTKVWAVEIEALGGGGYGQASYGMAARSTRQTGVFGGEQVEDGLNFQPEDVDLNCTVRVTFEAE